MKDHLNVNANTAKQPVTALLNKQPKTNENKGAGTQYQINTQPEDQLENRFPKIDAGRFDTSAIDGMDLDKALEHSAFIRSQAQTGEGRRSMSLAHNPITPQRVGQMLGGL